MKTPWLCAALAALIAAPGCREPEESRSAGAAGPWSPGSADLLFMSNRDGDADLYLLPAGDSTWTRLTDDPAGDNWAEWSPDGSRVVFQSTRSGNFDIWVMNADGTEPVRLTDDPAADYLPSWTPDGRRITFTSRRRDAPGDADEARIYIMAADGTGQRPLVPEPLGTSSGAAWAPDGRHFAAARSTGEGGADLFLFDAEGRVVRRLTDDDASDGAPAFSPDGSRLAFHSDDGERSRLVLMAVDGSGRRVIAVDAQAWYPRWSPDGHWLVYTAALEGAAEGDLDIRAIRLEGDDAIGGEAAGPITLAGGPGREAEARWRPHPTPGREIAMEYEPVRLRAALERLGAWLAANNPVAYDALQPGLDPDAIARALEGEDCTLPPDVMELYRWRDGMRADTDVPFVWYHRFMSLEQALATRRRYRDAFEGPTPGASWLPLLEFEGEYFFTHCRSHTADGAADADRSAVIHHWLNESPDTELVHRSVTAMLETALAAYERDAVWVADSADGMVDMDLFRLRDIHAELNPGAAFPYYVAEPSPGDP